MEALPERATTLRGRLKAAVARRGWLARRSDTDAFRVVNGAGDGLPGVEVDRYGDHAVLALKGERAEALRDVLLDEVQALGFAGVYLKVRPRQANVLVDTRRPELAPAEASRGGSASAPLLVQELGVGYRVWLGDGLSTGIFLDQREGRRRVRALSDGARVLNLFAYHGAFTVAAVAGGARETVTVDSSGIALDRAGENLRVALGLAEEPRALPEGHRLARADVFVWLRRCVRRGAQYDLVVLDPPSFSTTKKTTFRAARDYASLAEQALRCLAPGGFLLASTNHRRVTPDKFERSLRQGVASAERRLRALDHLPEPRDFPPSAGEPCHLKSVLLRVA